MTDLTTLTAAEISRLVGARGISARDVAEAFLRRAERLNPAINAVTTFNPRLMDSAAEVDRRLAGGEVARPLEGVPFVVKDVISTKGLRTTYGSLVYENNVPDESAVVVQRLQSAGAVVLGKSNTSEFATDAHTTNRLFGVTRNPVDPDVSVGGSSGGTAAAIAADMAPIGLGTDLGGSIRIPAAWCGICGIRPSPGRVPVYPSDYAWDTLVAHVQGPMARTVEDIGLLLEILSGQDDRDPTSLPDPGQSYWAAAREPLDLKGRRIAYCEDFHNLVPVAPEIQAATRAAARAFEQMGAVVEQASFDTSEVRDIIVGTRGFSMVARFADIVASHHDKLQSQLIGQTADALRLDLQTVAKAERLRTQYWRRVYNYLDRYELILAPTVGAPPFRLDRPLPTMVGGKLVQRFYDIFLSAYAVSLVGLPALSVPCGTTDGLPIGLQIIGRRLREDQVLRAAAAYAQAHPENFERRPIRLSRRGAACLRTR